MKKLPYLLAVTVVSGLASVTTPSSANPLASGLAAGDATLPALDQSFVQKVQAWSCQEKRRDMTLEQRRFCDGYNDDYYDDYGDYDPGYGYGYPAYGYGYPAYGLGVPFLSFGFNGVHHHHHHGEWD